VKAQSVRVVDVFLLGPFMVWQDLILGVVIGRQEW